MDMARLRPADIGMSPPPDSYVRGGASAHPDEGRARDTGGGHRHSWADIGGGHTGRQGQIRSSACVTSNPPGRADIRVPMMSAPCPPTLMTSAPIDVRPDVRPG